MNHFVCVSTPSAVCVSAPCDALAGEKNLTMFDTVWFALGRRTEPRFMKQAQRLVSIAASPCCAFCRGKYLYKGVCVGTARNKQDIGGDRGSDIDQEGQEETLGPDTLNLKCSSIIRVDIQSHCICHRST